MTFKRRTVLTEAFPDGDFKGQKLSSKGERLQSPPQISTDWKKIGEHISAENICLFSWEIKDELEVEDSRHREPPEEARLKP